MLRLSRDRRGNAISAREMAASPRRALPLSAADGLRSTRWRGGARTRSISLSIGARLMNVLDRPGRRRSDVFWLNELLRTTHLAAVEEVLNRPNRNAFVRQKTALMLVTTDRLPGGCWLVWALVCFLFIVSCLIVVRHNDHPLSKGTGILRYVLIESPAELFYSSPVISLGLLV